MATTLRSMSLLNSINKGYVYDVLVDVNSVPVDIKNEFFTNKKVSWRKSTKKYNSIVVVRAYNAIYRKYGEYEAEKFLNDSVTYFDPTPVGIIIKITDDPNLDLLTPRILDEVKKNCIEFGKSHLSIVGEDNFKSFETSIDKHLHLYINQPTYIDGVTESNGAKPGTDLYGEIIPLEDMISNPKTSINRIYFIYDIVPRVVSRVDRTITTSFLYAANLLACDKYEVYFDKGIAIRNIFQLCSISKDVITLAPIDNTYPMCLVNMKLVDNLGNKRKFKFSIADSIDDRIYPITIENISEYLTKPVFDSNIVRNELRSVELSSTTNERYEVSIMFSSFRLCKNLESFTCKKEIILKEIFSSAFEHTGLKEISLKKGLTEINNQAFSFTNIKEITIPNTVCCQIDKALPASIEKINIMCSDATLRTLIDTRINEHTLLYGNDRNLKRVYINNMDTPFGHDVIVGYNINELIINDLTDRLITEFQMDDPNRDTFAHPFKSLNIWKLVFGTRATRKLLEVAKTNPMGVVSIMSSLFVDTDVHMTIFSTSTSREDITVLTSLESTVQQAIEMGNCDKLLIEPCGYVSRKTGVSRLTDLRPDLENSLLKKVKSSVQDLYRRNLAKDLTSFKRYYNSEEIITLSFGLGVKGEGFTYESKPKENGTYLTIRQGNTACNNDIYSAFNTWYDGKWISDFYDGSKVIGFIKYVIPELEEIKEHRK